MFEAGGKLAVAARKLLLVTAVVERGSGLRTGAASVFSARRRTREAETR